jgi:hypothetical protein
VVVTTFEVKEWLRKNSGGDAHDMVMVVVVPFARKIGKCCKGNKKRHLFLVSS